MKTFSYTVTDPVGLHARPAGLLVKKAGEFKSTVTIIKGEKKADAKRIFNVMGLGVKGSDTIEFNIEGEDEDLAATEIQKFMQENL